MKLAAICRDVAQALPIPAMTPVPVRTHDFMDKDLDKAIPYGVYDVAANRQTSGMARATMAGANP